MENPVDTLENPPETVTKERKKPNITPEDRAQRAERMRQMATKRNDLLKKQKAERFEAEEPKEPKEAKPKTPRVKKEKPAAEPAKEPTLEPTVVAPAKQEKPKEPKAKKPAVKSVKVKTLVIQSSSDSEDYCDGDTTCESEEEEIVYIAKKSKSKQEITKPKAKPQRAAVSAPAVSVPPEPLIRVKFF